MKSEKLIGFIIPTRRFDFLTTWFDNMAKTVSDPSCMEVLIKFDSDQPGVKEYIENEKAKRPFDIKYVITPRIEGQFSIWVGMEQLFFMTDPSSYFIQILSDEPYFVTHHWDKILRQYIGFFPDHIFRLRLSSMKFANYTSHYECTFRPDSFAIYTRKWLTLTLGTGNCWGSDAFQQCVAFQLSLGPRSYKNIFRVNAQWRDVVPYDLEMEGLEFGVGVDPEVERYKHPRTLREWKRLTSYAMQKHFSYLASRLYCGIWAYEQNVDEYYIKKDSLKSMTKLYDKKRNLLLEVSHDVPVFPVIFQKIYINTYFFKRRALDTYRKIVKIICPIVAWLNLRRQLLYVFADKLLNLLIKPLWLKPLQRLYRRIFPYTVLKKKTPSKRKNKIDKAFFDRLIYIGNKYYQAISNILMASFFRQQPPPGIKVLYGKTKLPPRVKYPKKEDIQWAKKMLHEIDANKEALENSLISKEERNYSAR